jgi:hypothetical protein
MDYHIEKIVWPDDLRQCSAVPKIHKDTKRCSAVPKIHKDTKRCPDKSILKSLEVLNEILTRTAELTYRLADKLKDISVSYPSEGIESSGEKQKRETLSLAGETIYAMQKKGMIINQRLEVIIEEVEL